MRLGDWGIGVLGDREIGGLGDWGIGGVADWGIGGLRYFFQTFRYFCLLSGRGKFTKITISLNSTKTKISCETMKNVRENYHRLSFATFVFKIEYFSTQLHIK